MNRNEEEVLDNMKTPHNKYFVPLVWTTSLITRARKEGRIRDDFAVKTLIDVSKTRGATRDTLNAARHTLRSRNMSTGAASLSEPSARGRV